MIRQHRVRAILFGCVIALASASGIAAQQAKDILDTAMEKYEARMKSIENYTVVQGMMGMSVSTYFERREIDGHSVFVPSGSGMGDKQSAADADAYRNMSRMAEKATYEGKRKVGDRNAHVIRVTDPQSMGWDGRMAAGDDVNFQPKDLTLFISDDDYVMLRFEFSGNATVKGQVKPVTSAINFEDYRNVEGLLHPFRTTLEMEGMMDASMSPEDKANAEQSLAEMEKQLAAMPESQRKMMEDMLGDQLKQLRGMLEPGGGKMTIEVTEVRVNTGRSGE